MLVASENEKKNKLNVLKVCHGHHPSSVLFSLFFSTGKGPKILPTPISSRKRELEQSVHTTEKQLDEPKKKKINEQTQITDLFSVFFPPNAS